MRLINCVALCGVLFLTACQTMSPEKLALADTATCEQYGFKAGTDAFAQCRLQIDAQHKTDDYRQRRALASALSDMGKSMQQNRPVTCNSNTYGTGYSRNTNTTCY